MPKFHVIGNGPLVSHAFNIDASLMAVAIGTNDVYILSCPSGPSSKFQLVDILKEHTGQVASIDWCTKTDCILTASHDRNAYVWNKHSDGKWKPKLVMLKLNRAVLSARWSPSGNKFAVGSGAKLVAVAHFETEFDWWQAKHIKKSIKSTVACVDWHPNNMLVACGSTDYKVRVFTACLDKIEDKLSPCSWGACDSFGTLVYETNTQTGGWVHDIAFSQDGSKLVWVCHNSTAYVADTSGGGSTPVLSVLRYDKLPFTSCLWIGPSTVVAAGHDCTPFTLKHISGKLQLDKQLDQRIEKAVGKISAMSMFQGMDRMGQASEGQQLTTVHQNTISELRLTKVPGSSGTTVSSIGLDGLLVFWNIPELCKMLSGLTID